MPGAVGATVAVVVAAACVGDTTVTTGVTCTGGVVSTGWLGVGDRVATRPIIMAATIVKLRIVQAVLLRDCCRERRELLAIEPHRVFLD
jgi:hypothetical protein